MQLYTLGINHHTAPLAVRERLAFDPAQWAEDNAEHRRLSHGVSLIEGVEAAEYQQIVGKAARAVADAGLKMSDIDGLCTASVGASMWAMPVIEYLGIRPSFVNGTMLGGSSFVAHIMPAPPAPMMTTS